MSAAVNTPADGILTVLDEARVQDRLRAISVVAEMTGLGLEQLDGTVIERADMLAVFRLIHEEARALVAALARVRSIADTASGEAGQ